MNQSTVFSLKDKIEAAWINQAFERSTLPAITYVLFGIVFLFFKFRLERFEAEFIALAYLLIATSLIRALISYLGAQNKIEKHGFLLPLKALIIFNGIVLAGIFSLVAYEVPVESMPSVVNLIIFIGVCSAAPTSLVSFPIVQPFFISLITFSFLSVYLIHFLSAPADSDLYITCIFIFLYFLYSAGHGRKLRKLLQKSFENQFNLETEKENLQKTLAELTYTQNALLVEQQKTSQLVSTVQSFFLPEKEFYTNQRISLCGYYSPASDASGDWWWYGTTQDSGLLLLLGDVTGHGAASAMLTASTASQLHLLRRQNPDMRADQLLDLLNQEFSALAKGKFLMTMSALEIDHQKKVRWWNAAAPPIMIVRRRGEFEEAVLTSHPIGIPDFELNHLDFQLNEGDRLILYTDGLSELELPDGNQIRFRVLKEIFAKTKGLPIKEATRKITEMINEMRQGHPLKDDVTFVLIDCH